MLRNLLSDVVVCKDELKHDEVTKFVKENGYEKTPLILNVEGKRVAMNFISTRERLCKYLGIKKDGLASYLANTAYDGPIRIEETKLKKRNWNLRDLPILKYYPNDGGRYITAGVVVARWEKTEDVNSYNACIHRLMLLDDNRLAARLVKPRHTYLLWKKAVERGEDLPIAIAIGVHPLFLFASATRVPDGKEFGYAASLMKGLDMNIIEDMLVPEAEIILVGRITKEVIDEGPFVDITGTYDVVRKQPVVEIDAIYAMDDPIYYSITPASSEHQVLMGIPYEPEIYKSVSKVCKVNNVVMSPGGMHYFHAVVQIEKHSEGDGKNAILAAFTAHHSLKHVVVVDGDIDIHSSEDIEYAIATRFQADKDLVIIPNARGSSLDPSSTNGLTAKWGIDATKELSRLPDFERVA